MVGSYSRAHFLEEQCLDTIRVDHVFAGRPPKHSESAILRCHEGNCIPLVVRELGGRQVAGTSELTRLGDHRHRFFYWLHHDHAANLLPVGPPDDFCAEGQQLPSIGYDRGSIHRRQAGDTVNGPAECFLPAAAQSLTRILSHQLHDCAERRRDRVCNGFQN